MVTEERSNGMKLGSKREDFPCRDIGRSREMFRLKVPSLGKTDTGDS